MHLDSRRLFHAWQLTSSIIGVRDRAALFCIFPFWRRVARGGEWQEWYLRRICYENDQPSLPGPLCWQVASIEEGWRAGWQRGVPRDARAGGAPSTGARSTTDETVARPLLFVRYKLRRTGPFVECETAL